jgi:hypothetical protein
MSGISAVSPPINAAPACSQPSAMPPMTLVAGALDQHVIDAHCDQVDANRVVTTGYLGELQFCADAIRAGDQDGFHVSIGCQRKQAAKTAEAGHHFRAPRFGDQWLDALHE